MSTDTIVLTYAELAKRLGITIGSAKTRVRRAKWYKVKGSDRKMRVHVLLDVLSSEDGDGDSADQLKERIA